MWLQWIMLGIVVAFVLLGSVVFTAPSSNATISFIIVVGILLLGGHLNKIALQAGEPLRTVTYVIYFLIPHLEWYDIRDFITYSHAPAGSSFVASFLVRGGPVDCGARGNRARSPR